MFVLLPGEARAKRGETRRRKTLNRFRLSTLVGVWLFISHETRCDRTRRDETRRDEAKKKNELVSSVSGWSLVVHFTRDKMRQNETRRDETK